MKTLNIINVLIEKAESEREMRILDTVKNALIEEVKEASKKMDACSWWTEGTYDDDGYSNDDEEEVVDVYRAINIVESIIYDEEEEYEV